MAALQILTSISLLSLSLQTHLSSSQTTCKSHIFSSIKTTFQNCNDLPTLNALLHWTHHRSTSSLSVAFTARPPNPSAWASWALNPSASGMLGAQALIAFRPNSAAPVTVNTYNIQSYETLTKGAISYYNVTGISAEESAAGEITIFATWRLPEGQSAVNQVWQVGPVVNGRVSSHELDKANLDSSMRLDLLIADSPATGKLQPPHLPPPKGGATEALLVGKNCGGVFNSLFWGVVPFFMVL